MIWQQFYSCKYSENLRKILSTDIANENPDFTDNSSEPVKPSKRYPNKTSEFPLLTGTVVVVIVWYLEL